MFSKIGMFVGLKISFFGQNGIVPLDGVWICFFLAILSELTIQCVTRGVSHCGIAIDIKKVS
jgi:hypothetical protein